MNQNEFTYCYSLTEYKRLPAREVYVGSIPLGRLYPVRVQSMTNTNTNDTGATVDQIKRIADCGADFVRMTARTVKEAENLEQIKARLVDDGYDIPLVADIHFNPKIAEIAAEHVEKVRINPGNYSLKKSSKEAFKEIEGNFKRLIALCKKNHTAIRIGVNHGSLSQRIMDEFGDTPKGMVESAMEFLRISVREDFHQVVISLKSSNTRVMVQSNRLLAHQMLQENMVYPLHLGVTEAGEGEDGRIKSAVGIGTLLGDGIGDTIRVSLTETPENEIPVAQTLVAYVSGKSAHEPIPSIEDHPGNPFDYSKRKTLPVQHIGGAYDPVVITDVSPSLQNSSWDEINNWDHLPDFFYASELSKLPEHPVRPLILPFHKWQQSTRRNMQYPLFSDVEEYENSEVHSSILNFIQTSTAELEHIEKFRHLNQTVLMLESSNTNSVADIRRFLLELMQREIRVPVIVRKRYNEENFERLQLKASSDFGPVFVDGLAEGMFIQNTIGSEAKTLAGLSLGVLQASRIRIFKTEFISCPGCGRTQFKLEDAVKKVRIRLGHLKGLKIAVMGCIVNGPGEMADADYGYVGAGPGKISLYKNKTMVRKNIPEEEAVDALIEIIKEQGDWKE